MIADIAEFTCGSFDECRVHARWPRPPTATKPTDLGCHSAPILLSSPYTITMLSS